MARKNTSADYLRPKLLLVEGNDDLWVVANLCIANGLPEPRELFEIVDCKGYAALFGLISALLTVGNQKNLGILVDADTNVTSRWTSIRAALSISGYLNIPEVLPPEGLVVVPNVPDGQGDGPPYQPTIGIWIMPDNSLPGALEDFVQQLVPNEMMPLWAHAEACVANLPITPEPLTDNWRAKARIHSYLAWHEEPGTPLGMAITKRYLTGDTVAAQPFMNWLRRLFELDSAS